MKRIYFGTDGVRGPFDGPVMNAAFVARLAASAGRWVGGSGRVLIGRDTRASGEILQAAAARGLAAAGLTPVSVGVLPTPALARAVATGDAVLGVMITASHNPASDNGIKFFTTNGTKLSDDDEAAIEAGLPEAEPDAVAEAVIDPAGQADYIAAMSALLPANALAGWRIVLDTAHGATTATSAAVLRDLGAEVIAIGDAPNGSNINAGVGSEHPEELARQVVAIGARLGVAHDGDGDRCILCDELGQVLDGDEILTILATAAARAGTLVGNTLVVTVQSNLGVDLAVKTAGGRVERTAVGDRYVSERMRETGAVLGGESSGHIICADLGPTGDGLAAALRVLAVMHTTGRPLSELRGALRKFPQKSGAVRVAEKRPLESCAQLAAEIARLETELGEQGRLLVRYSGTEPKLRLLVEGPDDATVEAAYARLQRAAGQDLTITS